MVAVRYGRLVAIRAAICALLTLRAAPALEAENARWLGWTAPPECQNTAEVERRLESLLGRPVDFGAVPPTRVQMTWSADTGWAVRVTVELSEGPRSRSLEAPSCADALDVVALSLALILDPELEASASAHAGAELPLGQDIEAELAGGPLLEESEDAALAAAPEPPGADAPTPAPAPVENSPRLAQLALAGAALADLSTYPVPQFGAGALAGVRIGAFRVEIEGDILASESASLQGAEQRVSFTSFVGAGRACHALMLTARLAWVGCAGMQAGMLGTHELGGDERQRRGPWLASELLTGPEFSATAWLRAFARVRAVTPLIRHEFYLSGGSRAHELPWFGFQLQLGISADVTEFGGGRH